MVGRYFLLAIVLLSPMTAIAFAESTEPSIADTASRGVEDRNSNGPVNRTEHKDRTVAPKEEHSGKHKARSTRVGEDVCVLHPTLPQCKP